MARETSTRFTCDHCGAQEEREWLTNGDGTEVRPLPEGWVRLSITRWPDKVKGEYCSLGCVGCVVADFYAVPAVPDQPNTTSRESGRGGEA